MPLASGVDNTEPLGFGYQGRVSTERLRVTFNKEKSIARHKYESNGAITIPVAKSRMLIFLVSLRPCFYKFHASADIRMIFL
jgi:hypothetical protein